MRFLEFLFALSLLALLAEFSFAVDCPNGYFVVDNACVPAVVNPVVKPVVNPAIGIVQNTATPPCPYQAINNLPSPVTTTPCNNCPQTAPVTTCHCCNCQQTAPCYAGTPCNQQVAAAPPCNAVSPCNQQLAPVAPCYAVQPCSPANQPCYPPSPTPTPTPPSSSSPTPSSSSPPTQAQTESAPPPRAPIPPTPPPMIPTFPTPAPPIQLTTPPPGELTICPPGTVLIADRCRQIGCGKWSIYMNGKCIRIDCPHGTYWNGDECVEPAPTEFNFHFNNSITTQMNHTEPALVINNVNDWNVTVVSNNEVPKIGCYGESCANSEDDDDYVNADEEPVESEAIDKNCCTVVTPRICKPKIEGDQKSWSCYSRRYKRCGNFCIAPIVYLTAPEPVEGPSHIVLPPPETKFPNYPTEYPVSGPHDCSGCVSGLPQTCEPYCQRYVCPTRRCKFYDQRQYCLERPGQHGCQAEDGCYSDWCSNAYV